MTTPDTLTISLATLAGIRLLGALVFVDLYFQRRARYYLLLVLGWTCLALGSAWGVYTHTVRGAMEHYIFSLFAGMGTFWLYCGALRYFDAIRVRTIALGSFMILGYGLLPLAGMRLGPSPGVLVQALVSLFLTFIVLFRRRVFQDFARGSYTWLVALAVSSDALTLAFAANLIGAGNLALGFAGTSLVQTIAVIFFLHLEASLSTRQLQVSERKYRNMIQHMQEGFYAATLEGVLLDHNREFCNILGLDADQDQRGAHLPDFWQDPAERAVYLDKLKQDGSIRNYPIYARSAAGEGLVIEASSRLVQAGDGALLRIEGTFLDVTARKQAEEQLAHYTERLEEIVGERTRELREAQEQLVRQEKLAVLGQLAGGVGHELRNPLGVISNAVYFLKLVQPAVDEKVREYLGMIEREVHNANKIINDLLDFARIKAADRRPASVKGLVTRTLERFPAPEGVRVTLDLPEGLPPVHVDPRQVEQAFGNLVVNAYQAMPQGGQLSVISEQCSVDDRQWVQIVIKDTGVGIPPGSLDKLFEPLFTTKPKGIGLGLPISKMLAEANGGRIEAYSEAPPQGKAGMGSAFTVYLPIR
ncbi:MAG: ATP-binding protein [Chloroflexota bacterium]